ncbi:PAS domain S-box protein [Methanobacterium oryzae]|uniref:PAS domain S-box protein n=1 Tax=Methanobacterium oryzae TaxID=69540 RepID=UPI003D19E9A4
MEKKLRNSGIDIVGNAPWGTHLCQFYQTKEDLIDILIPYFKTGLENNEFCMWITSEPLSAEDAKEALKEKIPDIDTYIEKEQMEILPYTQWYVIEGDFDSDRILDGWVSKLNQALADGYDGLRLSGNTFWLEKKNWNDFVDYEEAIDNIIGQYQMIALCTYSLDKCTAAEIIDVVNNHEFALVKREGNWDLIENSEHKQTKEEAIQSRRDWEQTFDAVPDLIAILDDKHRIIRANKAMAEKLGVTQEECMGLPCYSAVHGTEKPPFFCPHSKLLGDGLEHTTEVHEEVLGGDFLVSASPINDLEGKLIGSVHVARDITERKKSEEKIKYLLEGTQQFAEELEVSNEELRTTTEELEVANEELRQHGEDLTIINHALAESEKRMNRSQEIAHIGSWELDILNNHLFWSDEVYRIFGLKPQEFKATYEAFLDAIYPDDRLAVDEAYSGSLGEGMDNYEIEHRVLRESGEIRFVHEKCEHIRDESGQIIRSIGMVHDITERKKAEESLLWNQRRNELLAEINNRLLATDNPQDIIDGLCQKTMEFLECDVFFNYLVDEEKGRLHLNAYGGIPEYEAQKIKWLEYGAAVCGFVALESRKIIAEDILNTPDERTDLVKSYGVQAYACHPLIIEGKTIGTLSFGTNSKTAFTDKELEVMKTISGQISIAMNRLLSNRALKEAHDNLEEQVQERTAELEEAYESLKIANNYNRSLIEASLDPLVTIGPDGKITDVNRATEDVTGFNRYDLIGTYFSNYFTEPKKAREGYQKVFRKGFVQDYPLEILHKEGHKTPVLYNASVYRDEFGKVIGVFAAARDITERKKAEEEIRRLANIVESSDDAIIGKSLDGVIISWNKGAEQMYGYTYEEVKGKNVSILAPLKLKNEMNRLIKKIKQGEKVSHYETVRLRKDMTEIELSLTLSPIFDTSRKLIGVSTIARDITERKKSEEELRLSNIYNRSLIEASLDPLVTIGPDGKITDVNASTEAITGYSRHELIGTDFSDYFTETEKAREGYKQVFREGEVRDYELEIRHKNGHLTPVLYNASAYTDESGKVIGIFAAARDITGIKQAEYKLKIIIDELKRSNKELQSFAFITSHDLQEPLKTIGNFAGLLKRRYNGRLDNDADEFIDYMVSGALRMQDMIRGLLKYSRVGTRGDEFKEFSAEKALNNALYSLQSSIEECNAEVTYDQLPSVFADESQIIEVFQNLMDNSLKFHREGIPPKIHVSAKRKGNEYVFSIQDNGIGIEKQYTERIFEVFKRLHPIGEYEGVGIGLAIVKRIMERHDGYIWVESELGKSSVFYFTIPFKIK